jgi:hypothetical protein
MQNARGVRPNFICGDLRAQLASIAATMKNKEKNLKSSPQRTQPAAPDRGRPQVLVLASRLHSDAKYDHVGFQKGRTEATE